MAFVGAVDAGLPVPALSACGRGTREIRYTQLLGYYLEPARPHGLRDSLLRGAFGRDLGLLLGHEPDWSGARVLTEEYLGEVEGWGGCYLDLLIEIPADSACIAIEQKIHSAEGSGPEDKRQLRSYSDALERARPGSKARLLKVFLTPDGTTPRDPSWRALSHSDLLTRLVGVLHGPELGATARHNLRALLWDLLMGPLATQEDTWDELVRRAQEAVGDERAYLRFLRWNPSAVPAFSLMLDLVEAHR